MAAPSQLNIVVSTSNGATVTTTTVTYPLSAGLQALDSGDQFGAGQASTQSGFASVEAAIRNIYKAGYFTAGSTVYGVNVIQSITWQ
jgi:hypothetical protein